MLRPVFVRYGREALCFAAMRAFAYRQLRAVSALLMSVAAMAVGVALAADTITYRWVDSDGVVHYSDTPHPGAEQITLSGAQTYHGTPAPASPQAAPPPSAAPSRQGYDSCVITQPPADTIIFAPEAVSVSVQVVPALHPGDTVGVQFDGSSVPGQGLNFQIEQPERGSHTLSAEVRSADGTVLCSAPAITFSIQRPSVNSPQSPVKPH